MAEANADRCVSLTVPARADYLVLARLALSAVCRLTPLPPEEVADLKLAITEAASDFVSEAGVSQPERRLTFSFQLMDGRLVLDLEGSQTGSPDSEQELARAIISATVDESDYAADGTRLVKYLDAPEPGTRR